MQQHHIINQTGHIQAYYKSMMPRAWSMKIGAHRCSSHGSHKTQRISTKRRTKENSNPIYAQLHRYGWMEMEIKFYKE